MDRVTRSALVEQVRSMAGMENSTFIEDAHIAVWIDNAARRLYNKLIAARGQEYYRREESFSLEKGTKLYTLSADFMQLLAVYVHDGPTHVPLAAFEMAEVARLLNIASPQIRDYRYRLTYSPLWGDQIEIYPPPACEAVITYHYIPTLDAHDADETEQPVAYNFISGFAQWVIYDVVALCLLKEESDPSMYMQLKAQLERDIDSMAPHRDTQSAGRVLDVRGDLGGLSGGADLYAWRPRG